MMNKNLISVIVPLYNGEKYLKKCINSVINQSYQNWELIIVNDCSTDHSEKIINDFINKDSRIKIINKEKNEKTLLARIDGIKIAKGEFITFLDSDDWFHKNALHSLIDNILTTKADIVCASWKRVFDNYGIISTKKTNFYINKLIEGVYNTENFNHDFKFSLFAIHGIPIVNWAKLYNKNLFNNINEINFPKMKKGEDLYLNLIIFPKVTNISFIKNLTYFYKDGGISHKITQNYLEDIEKLYLLRKQILQNSPLKTQAFQYIFNEIANVFFYYLIDCVYIGQFTINDIKNKYLEFNNNISYQDFIGNINKNKILYQDFFESLENNNFEKAYEIIQNKIKEFRFKRGIRSFIGNLLLKF